MLLTAWKIFEKGGDGGWDAWAIGLVSMVGMLSGKLPERIVIILAGIIGVIFLS
jgi:hypothetical protein